jgi:hypothetical protein
MANRIELEKNSSGDILMANVRPSKGASVSLRFTLGHKREELFVAGKGPANNDYHFARGDVFVGSARILTLTARIYLYRQSVALHIQDFWRHCDYLVDVSNYARNHLGKVSGSIDGRSFRGDFDPRSSTEHLEWLAKPRRGTKRPERKLTLRVIDLMSNQVVRAIDPLGEVCQILEARRVEQLKPHLALYNRVLVSSHWLEDMAQHACWGFGGIGAAMSCAPQPFAPLTCSIGAGAFGTAASVCSKWAGPEPTGWVFHPDPPKAPPPDMSVPNEPRWGSIQPPPDAGVPEEEPAIEDAPQSRPPEDLMSVPEYHVPMCTDEE